MKKRIINICLSVVITAFLLRYIVYAVDFGQIRQNLSLINPMFIALAALSYVFTYPLRTYRIYYMTQNETKTGFGGILPICFRHQFYGRIIPFKAGELSLVYLLRKRCGIPLAKGGAVLIFLRFFDSLVIITSFLVCNLFVNMKVVSGGFMTLILVALIIFLLVLPRILTSFVDKAHNKGWGQGGKVSGKILIATEEISEMLTTVSAKTLWVIIASSVVLWIFVYLSMYFIALAFGIDLTFMQTVVASFLASAAAFLPVNGLGGFGTTEAGWTVGFMMLGVSRETALVSGITSNLMSFVIVCIFGLLSFVFGRGKNVQDNNY